MFGGCRIVLLGRLEGGGQAIPLFWYGGGYHRYPRQWHQATDLPCIECMI